MTPPAAGGRYHPCYCEENVWHLAQDPALADRPRRVVFISNPGRQVAMWHQRAAAAGAPIVWDYHVILIAGADARDAWEVWDLDTTLGCPVALDHYLDHAFLAGDPLLAARVPAELRPWFRVVDADAYVCGLRTDRSHMRDDRGGMRAPPPPWPCIGPAGPSNLMRYVDVQTPFDGDVMDLPGLRRALGA